MKAMCLLVDSFFDGELSRDQADAFREHLVGCASCTRALGDRVAFDAMVEARHEEAEGARRVPVRRGERKSWLRGAAPLVAGLAVAAGTAGVFFTKLTAPAGRGEEPKLALLAEPTRGVEVRFAYGPADAHRPYSPARGAGGAHERIPLAVLGRLEDRKDWGGLAAAMVLSGDVHGAAERLSAAPETDDTLADRAAIAVEEGHPEEAVTLLEPLLSRAPKHPQALWNRALALTALHLPLLAAKTWDEVAALGEPGWAEEARARADSLRSAYDAHRKRWQEQVDAVSALVLQGTVPDPARVDENPSFFRNALYHAVNAAPSLERIAALRPLATRLDDPSGALLRRLDRLTPARLARRQRFLDRYRVLYDDGPSGDGSDALALIKDLQAAGEDDLFFAAVDRAGLWGSYATELERIARQDGDPWMALVAARARAKVAESEGRYGAAEKLLRDAVAECDTRRFDYFAARLEYQRVTVLSAAYRTHDADAAAVAAFARADAVLDGYNHTLRSMLALDAAKRGQYALARAFAFDAMLREPDFCSGRADAFQISATGYAEALDPEAAKRELLQGPLCDKPFLRGLHSPFERTTVLALLARAGVQLPETESVARELESARGQWAEGARLRADALEGDLVLPADPARGEALLRGALDGAKELPFDTDAAIAAAFSLLSLGWQAANAKDAAGVVGLFASQAGLSDARCSLALGADHQRVYGAVDDSAGATDVRAAADATRYPPPADALVPAKWLSELTGCPGVSVLSPPPVFGMPRLLPASLAWGYRAFGPRYVATAKGAAKRLVVSDVTPPADLTLRPLGPLRAPEPPSTWLRGGDATVARVLREMSDATEVQIHAHGLTEFGGSDSPVLALSADGEGRWALTAKDVASIQLRGRPVVVLAACDAAHHTSALHENWSLPLAFLRAGARGVIAATEPIPDAESREVVESVLQRIRAGATPAAALRDERMARRAQGQGEWVDALVLFE